MASRMSGFPTLSLPHIMHAGGALPSPASTIETPWDTTSQFFFSPTAEQFGVSYYNLPPSPPHSVGSAGGLDSPRSFGMRPGTGMSTDSDQLCLPTHELFDFPELMDATPSPPTSAYLSPKSTGHADEPRPSSSKRSSSPAPASCPVKKTRAPGERITTKDFVPPDVSGLSKREARLVKNRAAAFLSRQRKREEFELMEV